MQHTQPSCRGVCYDSHTLNLSRDFQNIKEKHMVKQYKVVVNEGKDSQHTVVEVTQGQTVRLIVQSGARYEFQDLSKPNAKAPEQLRLKRVGKDLHVLFDGSTSADVVLEGYYPSPAPSASPGGALVGQAENNQWYEYVTQDPTANLSTALLYDGNTPVAMALGGTAAAENFTLAAAPLMAVAAGGGVGSGVLIAGGLLAAAALGGGGGGSGGGAGPTLPAKATGFVAPSSDTGLSSTDGITSNTTPVYTGKAAPGSQIAVNVNGHTYQATAGPDGIYNAPITFALPAGTYTPRVTVTDPSTQLSTTADGSPFTIITPEAVGSFSGDNTQVTLQISAISPDNGSKTNDFITSANQLTYSGKVSDFTQNGDVVKLDLKDSTGKVLQTQYTPVSASNTWTWDKTADTQADGVYTLEATVVDAAGNSVNKPVSQTVVISKTGLQAKDDTGVATEAGGVANATPGADATGNVLSNDVVLDAAIQKKAQPFTSKGLYGTLTLQQDGSFSYAVDNTDTSTKVNALPGPHGIVGSASYRAAGTLSDTFDYTVVDSTGKQATAKVVVTIQGANDVASFTGSFTSTFSQSSTLSQGGKLIVADPDEGEQSFVAPTTTSGAYGDFVFNVSSNSNNWDYSVSASKVAAAKLDSATQYHDVVSVSSYDGSATQTIDAVINTGTNATTQVFQLLNTQGIAVNGKASTQDCVALHGSNMTLDFTQATTQIASIEKIDLGTGTGNSSNSVKLGLAELLLIKSDDVNGRLSILGDASDSVTLVKATLSMKDAVVQTLNGVNYNVYHLDSTHDVWIQTTISNVVLG